MRKLHSAAGMTLIEIAVSAGIMTIFILGLFASMATSQKAATFSREQQAASEAAFRAMDDIMSIPDIDNVLRNGANDVVAYAFHVPYGLDKDGNGVPDSNLAPADNAFHPLNGAPNAAMAGHVKVIQIPGGDWNLDTQWDYIEIQVTVAWRSASLTDANPYQRFEMIARKVRNE